MAFFDEIGKKISDAGQGVAQTAKNLSETNRVNALISAKEKELTDRYAAVGRMYYEQHKTDTDCDGRQNVEAITQLYTEIANYKEELKRIKGVVKCASCGSDIPYGSLFCTVCGAKQPESVPENDPSIKSRVCPSCGGLIEDEGSAFCMKCGAKL